MPLVACCPRCPAPVEEEGAGHTCPLHGPIAPLWCARQAQYDDFADLMGLGPRVPTYLPWPLSPGWSISALGCVADDRGPSGTVTTVAGTSALDGDVEITIVAEDPGLGLGARCAGTTYDDPGDQLGRARPSVHVRLDGRTAPMWVVDTDPDPEELLAGTVFAGEAEGRWLWMVVRPGSAALLFADDWLLTDVSGFGPEALEIPFGGPPPSW